jgi:hypothetical protein
MKSCAFFKKYILPDPVGRVSNSVKWHVSQIYKNTNRRVAIFIF